MPGRYPEGPWPIDRAYFPSADIIILKVESPKCLLGDIDFSLGATLSLQTYRNRESKLNAHATNCLLQGINSKPFFSDSFQLPAIKVFFIFRIPCPCKFVRTEHREICFCMVSAFHKMSLFFVLLCLAGEHVYAPDVKQTNRKRSYSHNRGTGKFRAVEVEENSSPKWSWRPLHP